MDNHLHHHNDCKLESLEFLELHHCAQTCHVSLAYCLLMSSGIDTLKKNTKTENTNIIFPHSDIDE